MQICPEVVLGKYVAITSIDSSPLVPSEKEMVAGWQSRERIAYSPKITSVEDVPRDGWDEWYVFDRPADLGASHLAENIFETPREPGRINVFVNYCFALHLQDMKELADMFWRQLKWIQPETYVVDNDYLTLVSRNKHLLAVVQNFLRVLPNSGL